VRLYLKAWERKQAGGDWRKLVEGARCHDDSLRIVQKLEADASCKTVEDRVKKFIEQTSACRATYFNMKAKLKDSGWLDISKDVPVPNRARCTSRCGAVVEQTICCRIVCCFSVSLILAALPDIPFLLFETET